ncbi:MAG TPA: tetratricopeptide repeat protein, partial [Polyangia bacterium]
MGIGRGIVIAAVVCAAAAAARANSDDDERAKAHFLAGQSYYEQASYTDALREFNEAYRISKRPALLYNIARCDEALEQYADAVKMLEAYLDQDPQTTDREAVETRIANLKEREAAQKKA